MRFGGSLVRSNARSYARSHAKSYARSYARSHARSHTTSNDYSFYDHNITIAVFFGISSNKEIIVKSYLQLSKKNPLI